MGVRCMTLLAALDFQFRPLRGINEARSNWNAFSIDAGVDTAYTLVQSAELLFVQLSEPTCFVDKLIDVVGLAEQKNSTRDKNTFLSYLTGLDRESKPSQLLDDLVGLFYANAVLVESSSQLPTLMPPAGQALPTDNAAAAAAAIAAAAANAATEASAKRAAEAEALLKAKEAREKDPTGKKKKRSGWNIVPMTAHLKIALIPVQVAAVEAGPDFACHWCAGTMVPWDKDKTGYQEGIYHTTWYCKKTPAMIAKLCRDDGLDEGALGPEKIEDCMSVYTQACFEAGEVPRYSNRSRS